MLNLNSLVAGAIPAIPPGLGAMLAEAASICLESQGHTAGNVVLVVSGYVSKRYSLMWSPTTPQTFRGFNDSQFATEHGAVGIAVLIAHNELEHTVVEASRKGTGFDWWLGEGDEQTFQHKGRLEVSGIRAGSIQDIDTRVRRKLIQISRSDDSGLPAYVIVVEFGRPVARVVEKR